MPHERILAGLLLAALGCSDPLADGRLPFCMQWHNTSEYRVTFEARDANGTILGRVPLMPAAVGDTVKSAMVLANGVPPISFAATQGFQALSLTPAGGDQVLFVEASRRSGSLLGRQEVGFCPGS